MNMIRQSTLILTAALLAFSSILIGSCYADYTDSSSTTTDDKIGVEKLPFCGFDTNRDISRRLIYVSTLDGTISALDVEHGGLKWSVPTNPGAMLSSSIHRLELTNNGQWVRMIPSLNGALYKFDGEIIEPIPVTVDQLLSSSFKFSDDLVISGGKETRTYGISSKTGKVLYECSMQTCKNSTEFEDDEILGPPKEYNTIEEDIEHDPMIDDLLIVRRQTQTVRALEPRTGGERWNFSVGHHELEILKPTECHQRPYTNLEKDLLDVQLKVIVPDGIVCAVKNGIVQWKYKFDHPIVSAWRTNKHDITENIDLFNYSHWPWHAHEKPNNFGELSPTVYVGMFQKQLYIQESDKFRKIILANAQNQLESPNGPEFLKIPWKPFPASSSALSVINNFDEIISEDPDELTADPSTTALSVLYASEYVNGNGFFLFSVHDLNKTHSCNKENNTNEEDTSDYPFNDDDTPAKIIIVSLWYWWKEIMVISLTTALILNVVLSRRLTGSREVVIVERHVEIKVPVSVSEKSEEDSIARRSTSESNNSDNFISRFQTDFDMVQCLGKGGFGVVFESKNKLDDCRYAIKRIILPNRIESRERVMREVKTLAHCEHQNIVRYFQAWVETPPPEWQEKEDRIWMDREAMSHSIDIESPTFESAPHSPTAASIKKVFNEVINRKAKGLDSWISNLNTNECINFDESNRKTSFEDSMNVDDDYNDNEDDDDSFIQFKEDTNDNVFASNNNNIINGKKTNTYDNDDEDSFQIEFKDDTQDETSSKDFSSPKDHSNSIRIQFEKPSGGLSYSKANVDWSNSNDSQPPTSPGIVKQRTFSENYEFINVRNSVYQKAGCIFTNGINNRNNSITNSTTNTNNSKAIVPFKKTHRRPLSLDLTSRRNAVNIFHNSSRMYLYIQMQLCKKQSLKDWLRLNDLQQRQSGIVPIFKQIVDGVEYCHLKGLIHRDLKPSNIFFSMEDQIKIGDFGLVTDMSDIPNTPCGDNSGLPSCAKHTEQVGTHLYMSPEQLRGQHYNYKVDIYSLGLIFFELLVVFGTEMERIETLKSLRKSIFPSSFATSFKDEYELLKLMLSQNPSERPTTIGIRARPPLGYHISPDTDWHFELPPRRRDSYISGGLSSQTSLVENFKKSK